MGILLLLIVLALCFGGAPYFGLHQYGWGPSGIGGLLLLILVILLLTGRL